MIDQSHSAGRRTILGLDPGREKCGVAVVAVSFPFPPSPPPIDSSPVNILNHDVVSAEVTLTAIAALILRFEVSQLVLGNQTSSKEWLAKLQARFDPLPIALVDERNSTLEARDRYWQLYPASGLTRWVPKSLRSIPGPVDGVVAILLVERYLKQLATEGSSSL